jgi:hypothetical protein
MVFGDFRFFGNRVVCLLLLLSDVTIHKVNDLSTV